MVLPVMGMMLVACMYPELIADRQDPIDLLPGRSARFSVYATQLEERVTGSLQHMGGTESQFFGIAVAVVSGLFGPEFWIRRTPYERVTGWLIPTSQYREIVTVIMLCVASGVAIGSCVRCMSYVIKKDAPHCVLNYLLDLLPGLGLITTSLVAFHFTTLFTFSGLTALIPFILAKSFAVLNVDKPRLLSSTIVGYLIGFSWQLVGFVMLL